MSKTLKIVILILVILVLYPILSSHFKPYGVSNAGEGDQIHPLAIQNRDISICDKIHLKGLGDITDAELRGSCYQVYARSVPEENVCARLLKDAPPSDSVAGGSILITFALCVNEQAKASRNVSMCSQIQDVDFKTLCVTEVANVLKDRTVCATLPTSDTQKRCAGQVAP